PAKMVMKARKRTAKTNSVAPSMYISVSLRESAGSLCFIDGEAKVREKGPVERLFRLGIVMMGVNHWQS
ncbi:MAG TPA: hypothetical protein VF410_06805, partial [Rhizomicrobium sp.]